jgi:DNA-binding SARP family transcriptional activator
VIEFNVLGRLTVYRDGLPVNLNAALLRRLLALLVRHAGEPVPVPVIVEALWDKVPPVRARKTVQVYIGRLRRALRDDGRITFGVGGYTLAVSSNELDVARFRTLVETGLASRERRDLEVAERLLTAALALWRETPYGEFGDVPSLAEEARDLTELRLTAAAELFATRLDQNRHAEATADLAELLRTYPYQERLAAYLMLALYRTDRRTEALDVFRRTRQRLAEDLGIEPGRTLSWLHRAVLGADSRLAQLRTAELNGPDGIAQTDEVWVEPGPEPRPPAQLPPDIPGFVGRDSELARLDALLDPAAGHTVAVISGTPGVGKTSLAVHWGQRVRDRFPDGQLYANLHGFDPAQPASATAVVRQFLAALHVPPHRVPADHDALVGLYRSELAGRRLLVVLDNARDAEQVRPLLPGSSGCLVVVTSRHHLVSLVAVEEAYPVVLDTLSRPYARQLLAIRLGRDRVDAEPDAADDIVDRCVRLPLALAVAAARAATRPGLPLAAVAAQLEDPGVDLGAFRGEDAATDLSTVFSWSYRALSRPAARMFRLLGSHPGPELSAPTAASLAGVPLAAARTALDELIGAHLLTEHVPGRYGCHDLLRAYAHQLAAIEDDEQQRRAARYRILDHYLHTAYWADRLIARQREPISLSPPQPGTTPEELGDQARALVWLTTEHQVLLAAAAYSGWVGLDAHAWQLTWALETYLQRQGYWHEQLACQGSALEAARRLRDPTAEAHAHRGLGNAHARLGHIDQARTHYLEAYQRFTGLRDPVAQARVQLNLGLLAEAQSEHETAIHHAKRALRLFKRAGDRVGQANTLNAIGFRYALLGEYRRALTYCRRALRLDRELGDPRDEAAAWGSLGYIHHRLGAYVESLNCYEHALALARQLNDRYDEARGLTGIGDTHSAAGAPAAAADAWRAALDILDPLDHPDARAVRAKLGLAVTSPSASGS